MAILSCGTASTPQVLAYRSARQALLMNEFATVPRQGGASRQGWSSWGATPKDLPMLCLLVQASSTHWFWGQGDTGVLTGVYSQATRNTDKETNRPVASGHSQRANSWGSRSQTPCGDQNGGMARNKGLDSGRKKRAVRLKQGRLVGSVSKTWFQLNKKQEKKSCPGSG